MGIPPEVLFTKGPLMSPLAVIPQRIFIHMVSVFVMDDRRTDTSIFFAILKTAVVFEVRGPHRIIIRMVVQPISIGSTYIDLSIFTYLHIYTHLHRLLLLHQSAARNAKMLSFIYTHYFNYSITSPFFEL